MSNVWLMGVLTGAVSSVLDNFATAMTMISLREADAAAVLPGMVQDVSPYVQNGLYWKVIAYASAVGGNILCSGSMSGLALMQMERLHVGWYMRNIGWKCLVGGLTGFLIMIVLFI